MSDFGETTEAYFNLDIFTDNTYTTVKRTITATSPNCLYTSAQQVTDFGAGANFIYAKYPMFGCCRQRVSASGGVERRWGSWIHRDNYRPPQVLAPT